MILPLPPLRPTSPHPFRDWSMVDEEQVYPLDLTDSIHQIHFLVSDHRAKASWSRLGMRLVPDRNFPALLGNRTVATALVLGFSVALVGMAAILWLAVRETALAGQPPVFLPRRGERHLFRRFALHRSPEIELAHPVVAGVGRFELSGRLLPPGRGNGLRGPDGSERGVELLPQEEPHRPLRARGKRPHHADPHPRSPPPREAPPGAGARLPGKGGRAVRQVPAGGGPRPARRPFAADPGGADGPLPGNAGIGRVDGVGGGAVPGLGRRGTRGLAPDVDFEREHLPSVNLELFRIVQEALSNAVRLGGNLEISSAKSKGTRISVRIPDGSGAAQE